MHQQIFQKRKELGDLPPKPKQNGSSSLKDRQISARSNAESIDDDQPKVEKLSMKKKGIGSEARAAHVANAEQTYSCWVKLNEEDYCRNRSADFKDARMMF